MIRHPFSYTDRSTDRPPDRVVARSLSMQLRCVVGNQLVADSVHVFRMHSSVAAGVAPA